MSISSFLRRRVRALESRDDYRAIDALLKGWQWPPDERPDAAVAFEDVTRRIVAHEATAKGPEHP